MSIVDHPARHFVQLNARIADEFGEHACWRATLDVGTITILEFGDRRTMLGKAGPVVWGWLRVFVHADAWIAEQDGRPTLSSDPVIENEDEPALDALFVGRRLLRVDLGARLSLTFSDNLVLHIDRSSEAPDRETLVEFRFPNGDYVDCYASGAIRTERSAP
jgi:hypothetical protein